MNNDSRNFLIKLNYPFSNKKELTPTIVFLYTPKDFKQIVENISKELTVDSEHFQTGDEFLVAFIKNQDDINKISTRYAHKISENGKFWFISNKYSLLNDENNFLILINSQFTSSTSLIQIKNDYYAKLFQLKDNISNVINIEHYRTRKRKVGEQNLNNERQNSIRLSPKVNNDNQLLKSNHINEKQIENKNFLNIFQSKHNLTNILIKKKS